MRQERAVAAAGVADADRDAGLPQQRDRVGVVVVEVDRNIVAPPANFLEGAPARRVVAPELLAERDPGPVQLPVVNTVDPVHRRIAGEHGARPTADEKANLDFGESLL